MMEGGRFKTHTAALHKKKKWSSVSEKRLQKWPSQHLKNEQPQVSVLKKRRRESQTPAQESLESEQPWKAKKKRRRRESQTPAQESLESEQTPVSVLGKRRRESQTPAQESLESKQPWKAKRKKKKKEEESQQFTSSLLKNSETFHKAKKSTATHKKKKNSVWEVDVETGIILVDKENMENLLETSRKDVDIVYVDMSKGQRSAKPSETEELPMAETQKRGCRVLHNDVRTKKNQKHPQKIVPQDAVQGAQPERISLPQSESLSPVDLEGKDTEVAVFCNKKSKKKSVQEPRAGGRP